MLLSILPVDRDIVYFAGGEWNVFPPRGYDLMNVFASQWTRVLWVDPGATRVPKVAWNDLARIGTRIRRILTGTKNERENIWVCSPLAIPYDSNPWLRKLNLLFQNMQLKKAISSINIRRPVIWTTTPLAIELIKTLESSLLIYDIQDEYTRFPGKDHALLSRCETHTLSVSDLVLVVSDRLKETKKAASPVPIHLVRNGVDYNLSSRAVHRDTEVPKEMKQIPGPIAGYIGNIYDRLDQELIAGTAERLSEWSFVFIGLVRCDVERLSRLENVYFLGMKPPSQLPGYMKAIDAGLIPHKVDSFTLCQNPVKLYEYLAAGLPVVSTPLPELNPYKDFVRFGSHPEDFSSALKKAIREKGADIIGRRQEVAMQNRWELRAEQAAELICSHLGPK